MHHSLLADAYDRLEGAQRPRLALAMGARIVAARVVHAIECFGLGLAGVERQLVLVARRDVFVIVDGGPGHICVSQLFALASCRER